MIHGQDHVDGFVSLHFYTSLSDSMTSWYYGSQGQQHGPISESELRRLLADGTLTQQTMVWRDGWADWKVVADVGEWQTAAAITPSVLPHEPSSYAVPTQCGLAIASMICGIVCLLTCYVHGIAAIPAVICGHMALKKIRESDVPMAGRGMAIAGLVTGYLGLLLQIAMLVFLAAIFYRMVPSIPSPP
jgi:hypothetical protein